MDVMIAPIGEEHIAGFHAAVDAVARERRYLAFLEGPPLDRSAAFVRANIAADNPQFVALHGRRVVGWCDVVRESSRPVLAHGGVLGIGLLAGYRRQGIGRRLLRAAIDAAFAAGMTRIALTVRQDNRVAIALYESFGFVTEGLLRNAVRFDGRYENLVAMALLAEGSGG